MTCLVPFICGLVSGVGLTCIVLLVAGLIAINSRDEI